MPFPLQKVLKVYLSVRALDPQGYDMRLYGEIKLIFQYANIFYSQIWRGNLRGLRRTQGCF